MLQVAFPGLYILFKRPFKFLALPSLALVFTVTLVLIRLAPKSWIEDPKSYWRAFRVYKKVSITFFVYMVRPLHAHPTPPLRMSSPLCEAVHQRPTYTPCAQESSCSTCVAATAFNVHEMCVLPTPAARATRPVTCR